MEQILERQNPKTALVTASYSRDFERCRLLCDTIDHYVHDYTRHIILVSDRDVALFKQLAGPKREIVAQSDLLPIKFLDLPDPLKLFDRRMWVSAQTGILYGWQMQQLRRIAIAKHATEDSFLFCDSDVVFVKEYSCKELYRGDDLIFYRDDNYFSREPGDNQIMWFHHTGKVLHLDPNIPPRHDYIATVIPWKGETMRAMCDYIEEVNDCNWVRAIATTRQFSECMIYGRYCDEVIGAHGHVHTNRLSCKICWLEQKLAGIELAQFMNSLEPNEVAICLQSFIGVPVADIRNILRFK